MIGDTLLYGNVFLMFSKEEKTGALGENPVSAEKKNINKLNLYME